MNSALCAPIARAAIKQLLLGAWDMGDMGVAYKPYETAD